MSNHDVCLNFWYDLYGKNWNHILRIIGNILTYRYVYYDLLNNIIARRGIGTRYVGKTQQQG